MDQIQKYSNKITYNSHFFEEEELMDIIESTFDTCNSNKEEIIWLICIIRGLLNIKNKRTEFCKENIEINYFQYWLYPILENYKKRWHHTNNDKQNTIWKY